MPQITFRSPNFLYRYPSLDHFQRVFGDRPNKGLWVNAVMLNQLEPFTDPRTGERMHLVTSYIMHPKDPEAPHNGAWYLVRKLDGTYAHGTIYPEGGLPSGQSLHGVRTIIESPFPEESVKHAAPSTYLKQSKIKPKP